MVKKIPKNDFVSEDVVKEILSYRPLRLFINKQKKKGNENNPFAIRRQFLQISTEKQMKYYQKAIDKYTQLLDDKNITEQAQIDGQLLDILLSKKEQKTYYESMNAPTKPLNTGAAYYAEEIKHENIVNPKPWKSLSVDEKKPYIQILNNTKAQYSNQVKNFADDLPERLKAEYLAFINQTHASSTPANDNNNDVNTNSASISQRRKSVQSVVIENDNHPKLTRIQLDDLHKCKPNVLYYEKKVSDDDKPTFINNLAKNTYVRSLFNDLSEKKRHKFILKSIKKWEEYLESNPTITKNQIPTLHLLLAKQDDIHYYFSSLGLPSRPPVSALLLFNNERQQTGPQKNWADLNQTTKDEYIKRLAKIKNEYHEKFIEFVEKTLPSDYIRFEFFRNVKYAAKDYETFTKDRVIINPDEGQLKITQYLKPKNQGTNDINEFDRIKQQLLSTQLNNEQKKLVEKLGQLMNKYIEETAESKKNTSSSIGATKRQSIDSSDVVIINGDIPNDNIKKKKKKRDRSEVDEKTNQTSSKKRK